MKEEKVGKKPKGMVVVISVGKPGGKKPEREADPDMKKKAAGRTDPSSPSRTQHKYSDRRGPNSVGIGKIKHAFMLDRFKRGGWPWGSPFAPTGPSNLIPLHLDRGVTDAGEQLPPETMPMSVAMTPSSRVTFPKNYASLSDGPFVNYASLPDEAWASGSTQPTGVENPLPMYNRSMNIEGKIPFEDPHMELRLEPEERELDQLQGVQGDSPNIRPRLHALHGSKHSPLQRVPNPNYLAQPSIIPRHEWVDAPLTLDMLFDPDFDSSVFSTDEDKIRYQDGKRQEYRQLGYMRNPDVDYRERILQPMKTAVQQRRGEGIIQRGAPMDLAWRLLKNTAIDPYDDEKSGMGRCKFCGHWAVNFNPYGIGDCAECGRQNYRQ